MDPGRARTRPHGFGRCRTRPARGCRGKFLERLEGHPDLDVPAARRRPGARGRRGCRFYGLLALFPAMTALVSSYALSPRQARSMNTYRCLPASCRKTPSASSGRRSIGCLRRAMKLGAGFSRQLPAAVWSANGGMKAIIDALNVVYEEDEKRGFFKLNAVSLAFTFGGWSRSCRRSAPWLHSRLSIHDRSGYDHRCAVPDRTVAGSVMTMLVGLALLYRFGPAAARRGGAGSASAARLQR